MSVGETKGHLCWLRFHPLSPRLCEIFPLVQGPCNSLHISSARVQDCKSPAAFKCVSSHSTLLQSTADSTASFPTGETTESVKQLYGWNSVWSCHLTEYRESDTAIKAAVNQAAETTAIKSMHSFSTGIKRWRKGLCSFFYGWRLLVDSVLRLGKNKSDGVVCVAVYMQHIPHPGVFRSPLKSRQPKSRENNFD